MAAAAAYAVVVSLSHLLNRIQHPLSTSRLILLDKLQIQSLLDKLSFFLDFLENYNNSLIKISQDDEAAEDTLESQIANVAYAAEDIIESYITEQIHATSATNRDMIYALFCQDLHKVIQEIDVIKEGVLLMQIKEKKNICDEESTKHVSISKTSTPSGKNTTMVGFEEELTHLLEKLARDQPNRLTISVVGMGGIGKTTLARNAYAHRFIVHRFYIRAWVTISQDYNVREILIGLLHDIRGIVVDHKKENSDEINKENGSHENLAAFTNKMSEMSDEELGEQLHKVLFGRKYLIVMDDIWSSVAWDEISKFLPDHGEGSRVMLTTRLKIVASDVGSGSSTPYEMKFMDEDKSWDLLSDKVFGQDDVCPPELENLGKRIAKNCRGLPLAIVVIGGLLKVSNKTQQHWEDVAEKLHSIINTENDEHCLKILSLSYNHLPIHLKPLFLYMAIFPEDYEIRVSRLIKLWVSEGFLKPIVNKTQEDVALEYLKDLINRNLVMVQKRGFGGSIKICNIHDFLRDYCLREAHRDRFLRVTKFYEPNTIPEKIECARHLGVHRSTTDTSYCPRVIHALRSASRARSLVCNFKWISPWVIFSFNLLRVLDVVDEYSFEDIMHLVNSRYLAFSVNWKWPDSTFSSSISLLWNLETLIIFDRSEEGGVELPSEIWEMPHLRHIECSKGVWLPGPPPAQIEIGESSHRALENLQTLNFITNFYCTDEVVNMIPNLKILGVIYTSPRIIRDPEYLNCLKNFVHLCELNIRTSYALEGLNLSPNLRKLTIYDAEILSENMAMIGSLPKLEVLKLHGVTFYGREWNAVEEEFQSLKYLSLDRCESFVLWLEGSCIFQRLEGSCIFQSLEHLVIRWMVNVEDIPQGFGEITSLELIELDDCSSSVVMSAKRILEGNDDLRIHVRTRWDKELLNLADENFQVDYIEEMNEPS